MQSYLFFFLLYNSCRVFLTFMLCMMFILHVYSLVSPKVGCLSVITPYWLVIKKSNQLFVRLLASKFKN